MITRTFRAANMLAALDDIQRTLGPDALVVSVRQIPAGSVWEVWRKPEVEVVAMAKKALASAVTKAAAVPAPRPPAAVIDAPAKPATGLAAPVEAAARAEPQADWPAPLGSFYHRLLAQELDETLARRVVTACAQRLDAQALGDEMLVREQVQGQLEAVLNDQPQAATASVICLIGPSGSGKTATAAKLAAHFTKRLGLHVAWVCADTFRAGAIGQARIYAEALKLPLRIAYTPAELAQAVAAEHDADVILVDTPACNPRRTASVVELGELLTVLPPASRAAYLTIAATAKVSDALEAVAACKPFDPKGLVLTKLDETRTFGSCITLAWRSSLPLAYYTTGPEAHSDLHPAQARPLVNALFGEGFAR